jgi:ribosomal protein S1
VMGMEMYYYPTTRLEEQKNISLIEEAFKNKTVLKGKIVDVVKGGLMARIKGVKVFVPSSQVSSRFVDDLSKIQRSGAGFPYYRV